MSEQSLRILIADDNNTDRMILRKILQKEGHEVFDAPDGQVAVELFEECKPDAVFLDALMPNMDGYEAAEEIKKSAGAQLVPIIFLTSLTEAEALARCLEVGGDDFLTKPYNGVILKAKLNALIRLQQLYHTVTAQRDEIQFNTERLIHEQEVAKKVFDNIAHTGCLEAENVRYTLSPMSVFNGDMLLAAPKPSGGTHIFIGDFTGHGLPAAIGAMPVSEIFYGMTMKGFAMLDIVAEINSRLKEILPVGVFCCAIGAEIDYREEVIRLWNGGLPAAYLIREGEGVYATIDSNHLPLGVLSPNQFDLNMQVEPYKKGDRLYMMSDGVIEACSPTGEMFGEARLLDIIETYGKSGSLYQELLNKLAKFCDSSEQDDDITFVEFTAAPPKEGDDHEISSNLIKKGGPLDWSLHYELRPLTLKNFDPLPLILQIMMENPSLRPQRGRIFTILAELYANALDHGVLQLDSKMKETPDGFTNYYRLREERLVDLQEAYIRFSLEQVPINNGGKITIRLEDSGPGFDYQSTDKNTKVQGYSGRGIALLKTLCENIEYQGRGNIVEAVYVWSFQ